MGSDSEKAKIYGDKRGLIDIIIAKEGIKSPRGVLKFMRSIEYNAPPRDMPCFTTEEVIQKKKGHCYEQTWLEAEFFKKLGIPYKTWFIDGRNGKGKHPYDFATHMLLTYNKDGKAYWLEHSWYNYAGIHEYDSAKDMVKDVSRKMLEDYRNKNIRVVWFPATYDVGKKTEAIANSYINKEPLYSYTYK